MLKRKNSFSPLKHYIRFDKTKNLLKYTLHLFLLFFFIVQFSIAQNYFIVLDSLTLNPIPFATIMLNDKKGWVTNDEGQFQFPKDTRLDSKDTLFLSSLGYNSIKYALHTIKDSIFILSPKPFLLDEVVLTNKNLSVEDIIDQLEVDVHLKYDFDFNKKRVFFREYGTQEFKKLLVMVRRNSIPALGQSFWDSLLPTIPPKATWYEEFLASSYGDHGKENQKLKVEKALELADEDDLVFEDMDRLFNQILLKNIKMDSYFKVRSGLISQKIGSGELQEAMLADSTKIDAESKGEKANNYMERSLNRLKDILSGLYDQEKHKISVLDKKRHYDFELIGLTFMGETPVYEIHFEPKKRGYYQGKMFVDADRFALVRIEYKNVIPIKSIKLFNVFYKEFLKTILFQMKKLPNGRYALQYFENESGYESGMRRPINIIEKNKNVRGRRKQNELALDADLHFITNEKIHLVVLDQETFTQSNFEKLEFKHQVIPEKRNAYDPSFWEGELIMEPNQALRNFKSEPKKESTPNGADSNKNK